MMKNRMGPLIAKSSLLMVAAVFIPTVAVMAQSSAGGGTIQGTIKDGTGAVIPGARVIIRHLETGRVTNTEANSEGFFSTPPLNIGKYRVRVEATGMKAWEGDLVLETGRIAEVNPALTLGDVSETVMISGSIIPLVTTTDPTDANTLDSMRIQELPINGRDLDTLIEDVTPGVEATGGVNGGVRISGLMTYSTDYVQDGASSNNREFGGSGNLQGLESIAEVRVETSTSSARYNRPTSVVVTTRGGTNQLRGALFETHRNNAFGVARARQDVFLDGTPFDTPKLIRNEYGGSIGGPVYLPTF
ncbi:MAG: carboxypeptidase regulatory-like domain-containing protein, partial [Gammaproteobacteria bacterium]